MHCLATTAGEHMFNLFVAFSLLIWAMKYWSRKLGTDGAVKKAAKRGVLGLLSRFIR